MSEAFTRRYCTDRGGAHLAGIIEIMEEYLNISIRAGIPENLQGIPSDINRPEYATVIGGLIYSAKNLDINDEDDQGLPGLFNRLSYWVKDFFG